MGTGNLTELTDADSGGVTAALLGICSELRIRNVLVVQVSPHTRRTIQEHDAARRMMFAAREDAVCRATTAARWCNCTTAGRFPIRRRRSPRSRRRSRMRIFASRRPRTASTSTTATATMSRRMRSRCFPSSVLESDAPHAFYLGAELMKAEIAWRLGKRYAQDEPLDWGAAVDRLAEDRTRLREAGHTLRARAPRADAVPMIRETIVTTVDAGGRVHIAPLGIIADGEGWIIAPFRPSTTLDNLRAGRSRWRTTPTMCASSPAA